MKNPVLIKRIARDANISNDQAKEAIDSAIAGIRRALQGRDKVTLPGFGTFKIGESGARSKSSRADKMITIAKKPSKNTLKFTPAPNLLEALKISQVVKGK